VTYGITLVYTEQGMFMDSRIITNNNKKFKMNSDVVKLCGWVRSTSI